VALRWDRRSLGRYGRLAVALLAVGFGLLTLGRAHHDPGASFAGASTLGGIAELGAGWSLAAAGLLFWDRHPRNRVGPLLVSAGFAWFLPEWSNPGVGTALGFTLGLIGFAACVPLAGHAALSYPQGRLRSVRETLVVAFAYVAAVVLLGLLPAATFDPEQTGCQCPRNLALVHGDASLFDSLNRWALRILLVAVAVLGAALLWRLARATRATLAPVAAVVVPAAAFLALYAWELVHSLGRGVLSNDAFDVRTWRLEALALAVVALGVGWGLLRERQARASVARLVVELGRSPRPGAVRDAVAGALGDPTLELAYRRPGTDTHVDANGRPVAVEFQPGRAVTPLRRGGTDVAALVHDARLLEQPGLVEQVLAAARLAVENEQLQAEVRAQIEDLRASRARIVETGDAERRRLERDLHDGAQQRIVALSLALRLLRSQLGNDPDREQETRIEAAEEKLRQGLAELRELAHGIYPAVLADEGLAAALETLSEQSEAHIRLESLTNERLPPAVEHAAYFTVVESIKGAEASTVSVEREDAVLHVRVHSKHEDEDPQRAARLVEIADRVGALDGRLRSEDGEIRAEIPCRP
jgi:signal transduction histidine kinase